MTAEDTEMATNDKSDSRITLRVDLSHEFNTENVEEIVNVFGSVCLRLLETK